MKIYKIIVGILLCFVFIFIGFNLFGFLYAKITPKLDISNANAFSVYDNKEKLVFQGNGNDSWVSLDKMNENVINATLSVEDKNFYKHWGFDFPRIGSALLANFSSGEIVQGASTITQQYAKNLFLDFEQSWKRKWKEMWLTFELESHYSKDEILEGYLNTINYGHGMYGISNASKYYFGKDVKDLTLAEASILAGIPNSPSDYSPVNNYELSKERQETLEKELEILLLPKDENDEKNVIMELRGAAGGDEANIFAGDLFRMYQRYSEKQGWKIEIINAEESASGGFSQIECIIKGNGAYSKLKYESGAHRVQRIPQTESGGRIHTSTATVIVMPEEENVEIEVKQEDIKVDVYRSGGAGGQSVNTTDSAVRMTHLPTGIVVTCQNERSQLQNKEKALQILKSKIYEEQKRKQEEESGMERRSKIGTGDRSEKIRTYNYPQNRVTDHRISLTLNKLDRIIEGELEEVIEALINEDQKRKLAGNED